MDVVGHYDLFNDRQIGAVLRDVQDLLLHGLAKGVERNGCLIGAVADELAEEVRMPRAGIGFKQPRRVLPRGGDGGEELSARTPGVFARAPGARVLDGDGLGPWGLGVVLAADGDEVGPWLAVVPALAAAVHGVLYLGTPSVLCQGEEQAVVLTL